MVSTDKEWELELILKQDSTFILKDEYGCNKTAQKGNWRVIENTDNASVKTFLLTDNLEVQNNVNQFGHKTISYQSDLDKLRYENKEENQFPLMINDTIRLVTKDKVLYKTFTFDVYKGNLQEKRLMLLENIYINKLGKDNYIKTLGEGKGIKKARENLLKCQNAI
ncbi:MAG: hypothetical protein V3U87_07120 [Methylococcaceae bacterium]